MIALVVGGSRGIGLGLVRVYLQAGYTVYATCRKPAAELQNLGAVVIEGVDVATEDGVQRIQARAVLNDTRGAVAQRCGPVGVPNAPGGGAQPGKVSQIRQISPSARARFYAPASDTPAEGDGGQED